MTAEFIAFDIETVKPFPTGEDWRLYRPLGIACVATTGTAHPPRIWHSVNSNGSPADRMTSDAVGELVDYLRDASLTGNIVSWNGISFDWPVLAEESGKLQTCKDLTLNHVDMMYHLFCIKGFPLGLNTAAQGMGVGAKTEGMSGATSPEMWAEGKRHDVMAYCLQDAALTLELAKVCQLDRGLNWIAKSGNVNRLQLPNGWLNVLQARNLPYPDTQWMDSPIPRQNFDTWLQDQ